MSLRKNSNIIEDEERCLGFEEIYKGFSKERWNGTKELFEVWIIRFGKLIFKIEF